jgi:phospholipid/cholesterol/gamma-HCH transport system permease protein
VAHAQPRESAATLRAEAEADGSLRLRIAGRLDARTTGGAWRAAERALAQARPRRLVLDASGLDYCDGSGVALLSTLRRRQEAAGAGFELVALRPELAPLLVLLDPPREPPPSRETEMSLLERVGRAAARLAQELVELVGFVGESAAALAWALTHPRRVRWRDAILVAQRAGAEAAGIVALVGFLFGLILCFQSANALQRFGAEVFMADGLSIGLVREMSALLTAILLAGRSGSAFAAEIGTMKVNEELDALTTMGIEPVRFLVVSRVLASVAMTPLLAAVFGLFGFIGGGFVFTSFGYGAITFVNRAVAAVTLTDLLGGLFKAFVFSLLVSAIGCLRGLQTGSGPSAVGLSTTRAVVSGIVLIAVADGVLAVVYSTLGI